MRFKQYLILVENKKDLIITKQGNKILAAFEKDHSPYPAFVGERNLYYIVDKLSDADVKGKFLQWIVNQYINRNFQLEDIHSVKKYLTHFVKFKRKLMRKDISQYKTFQDLQDNIDPYIHVDKFNEKEDKKLLADMKKNKEFEIFYNDSTIEVIIPKTFRASCFFGRDTKWCTADEGDQYAITTFNNYIKQGTLYIIIPKNKPIKGKMQFHFEAKQFMDYKNKPIKFEKLDKTIFDKIQVIFKELIIKHLKATLLGKY